MNLAGQSLLVAASALTDYVELTDLGRRLLEPVEMLYAWGPDNADALDQLGPRASSRHR